MIHTKLKPVPDRETNLLNELHSVMADMPTVLRNKICEECGWDSSTYYRKRRESARKGKVYNEIERINILMAYLQTLQIAFDQVERCKHLSLTV